MKRFFKRLFIGSFVLILLIYCFKGVLYRNLITYKEINQRTLVKIEENKIKNDLDIWLKTNNNVSTEQVIDFAHHYSTENINYTFGKCSTDPNKVILEDKKTNCVGYSASLHSVLSYLLKKKGLSSSVKSEHKVGQLYLGSFNIHRLFQDPAFKDHDYNVITDLEKNKRYVIDPTLSANFETFFIAWQ